MIERTPNTDTLHQADRRAAEIRREHGAHLSQAAQSMVEGWKTIGLSEILEGSDSERKKFAQFLASSLPPGATPDMEDRAKHIGQVLLAVNGSAADRINELSNDPTVRDQHMRFITEQLVAFNKRMEIAHTCADKITPDEIQNLFAGRPNLERLFIAAGSNPTAIKTALQGHFEWAAVHDDATFQSLYSVLNRFAEHTSAEKRWSEVRSEKKLKEFVDTFKKSGISIDLTELRRRVNPTGSRSENVRNVREYLQEQGMGFVGSWFASGSAERIAQLAAARTQESERQLGEVAQVCDGLLGNDAIYAGALDDMLRGKSAAAATEVLTSETARPMGEYIRDNLYNEDQDTLHPDVGSAWLDWQRAHPGIVSTDRAAQRRFLDEQHRKRSRGFGFFRWLIELLWGRKRDAIINRGALDGISA